MWFPGGNLIQASVGHDSKFYTGISIYLLTKACFSAFYVLSFLFSHTVLHILYFFPLSFPFSSIPPVPISTMSAKAYLSLLVCVLQLSTYTPQISYCWCSWYEWLYFLSVYFLLWGLEENKLTPQKQGLQDEPCPHQKHSARVHNALLYPLPGHLTPFPAPFEHGGAWAGAWL